MPVMCVVRISAPESFVIVAFCSPMMKHSSVTVTGTKKVSHSARWLPSSPNSSSSAASTSSGSMNWLCRPRRRPQLTRIAEQLAPIRNDPSELMPASASRTSPSAVWSAIADTMPLMCDVYCLTARKPPALAAPATNASENPS